jgi:hypothetical protein
MAAVEVVGGYHHGVVGSAVGPMAPDVAEVVGGYQHRRPAVDDDPV